MALVELKGGLLVSEIAFRLFMALENRGHHMTPQDGKLHVVNRKDLTGDDVTAIKQHRMHLLALAGYQISEGTESAL